MVSTTNGRRLADLEAQIKPRQVRTELEAWASWATCGELMQLEALYRTAEDEGAMSEADEHRAMALYATVKACELAAPAEVHADPEARDAYIRNLDDRDKRRWYP
jgi:hypothetical protein